MEQGIGNESGCHRLSASWRRLIGFLSLAVISALSLVHAPAAKADNAAVTVAVDASLNKHPISPYIYGVALGQPYVYDGSTAPTTSELEDLNAPLNRYGGDDSSTYNWQINGENHPENYFESIPDDSSAPSGLADMFVTDTKMAGAAPMITIPMIDYIATLGPDRAVLCSFQVSVYGQQQAVDPNDQDCGNGVAQNGTNLVENDPPGCLRTQQYFDSDGVVAAPGFQFWQCREWRRAVLYSG